MGRKALESLEGETAFQPEAGLYVIATPIGNLGDISLRALAILASATCVYCEDTRVSGGLLQRYGISKPLVACHDHNEAGRVDEVLARIERGEVVAQVSDAGTPLISDPGFRLVAAARAKGLHVEAVPGASAMLTAVAGGGVASDRLLFVGFLPPKSAARKKALDEVKSIRATMVFYEAPQRLADSLADMAEVLGTRKAVVGRELTKLYEEMRPGTLPDLAAEIAKGEVKGECVILVEPAPEVETSEADLEDLVRKALATMSVKEASAFVAEQAGVPKKRVYALALELSGAMGR